MAEAAVAAGVSRLVLLSGRGEEDVWLLDYIFATVLDGRNAYVADGVRQALGREPRDFGEYAASAAATGTWDEGMPRVT